MFNKIIFRFFIITLSLLLSACQLTGSSSDASDPNQPVSTLSGPWLEHKKGLENLNEYQARGKFAYITANKTTAANFAWYQRTPNDYRLLLTTPFGNRIIELNVAPNLTQLTDDKNQIHINSDAQALIYQLTGMEIPLNNLRQWLIGLPGESSDFLLDKNYRINHLNFTENGANWQVKYLSYKDDSQPALPSNLELTQGDLKIKIRISDWELP
jgi:outer membrane lipoprotein LolB